MTDQVDNLANIRTLQESQTHSSGFVASVLDQFSRRGALSTKQWDAVARIADNIRNPKPKVVLDFAAIAAIFKSAAAHLKFPKVRLALRDLSEIVLSRAGARARQPGTINVTNGGRYGDPDNKWYGRIAVNGEFQRSGGCTDEIADLLVRFSADPAGVAAAHGKLTGNCCFCGRKLSDERSTDMGYGPVCARNFGLAWGDKLVTATPESKAFEAAFDASCEVCGKSCKRDPDDIANLCNGCEAGTSDESREVMRRAGGHVTTR